MLRPPVSPGAAVITEYTLGEVSSKRRRSEEEARFLSVDGEAARVFRLQGPLAVSTVDVVLRSASQPATATRMIVFDCERVHACDAGAARLFERFIARSASASVTVVFAGLRESDPGVLLSAVLSSGEAKCFQTTDLALEWCEDQLLADAGHRAPVQEDLSLADHPMLQGLPSSDIASVAEAATRVAFLQGQRILSQGEPADCAYLLMSGSVSVGLTLPNGERYRIATMGPGSVFGELALIDADPRTADVDAETDVECYQFRAAELDAQTHASLVSRLASQLAARLRRADREIASLAS